MYFDVSSSYENKMYIQNQRFATMEEFIGSRFMKACFRTSTRLYRFCANSLTNADYSRNNSHDNGNMDSMMIARECIHR